MPETVKTIKVGDAYLVVARTNLDEIPIELCPTLEHAYTVATSVTEEEIYRIAGGVMGVDQAGICSIAVIVFLAGKPIHLEKVREWDVQEEIFSPLFTQKRREESVPK